MRFDLAGYPAPDPDSPPNPHSQVIAVADCYDALTSMRSYQKARTPQGAMEIMRKLAGKSLDPDIVLLLERSLGAYPVGTMLRLSTMEVGIVTTCPARGGIPDRGPLRPCGEPSAGPETVWTCRNPTRFGKRAARSRHGEE